jgi:hypothetical protein
VVTFEDAEADRHATRFYRVVEQWPHSERRTPNRRVGVGWVRASSESGPGRIPLQSREVFGDQARLLCDFFHVSGYLGAAAPPQPDQWRRTQQQRIERGAVPKVMAALAEHLEA